MVVVDSSKSLAVKFAKSAKFFVAIASIVLLSTESMQSMAASATGRANVTLVESINFQERKFVDYGNLVNENGSCTLTASGQLQGSNGSSCNGNGQLGEFIISGTPDQAVSISVTPGESLSGITFTPELLSLSSTVLVNGHTVALVGGTLDLENAAFGSHSLSYTISVNYD